MRVLVYSINGVNVSTATAGTERTLTVNAEAYVNSGGWSAGDLSPWMYVTPPADGILDLDFTAEPPKPGTIVTTAFTKIAASLTLPVPEWVRGARVHAAQNEKEALLEKLADPNTNIQGNGDNLPWPFPWFREISEALPTD